jgi:hypothetical protein
MVDYMRYKADKKAAEAAANEGWIVVVRGKKIDQAGALDKIALPAGAREVSFQSRPFHAPGRLHNHSRPGH